MKRIKSYQNKKNILVKKIYIVSIQLSSSNSTTEVTLTLKSGLGWPSFSHVFVIMSLASFFRELKSHANTDKTEFRDLRVLAFSYFLHSWRKSSLAAFSLPYVRNKNVHLSSPVFTSFQSYLRKTESKVGN